MTTPKVHSREFGSLTPVRGSTIVAPASAESPHVVVAGEGVHASRRLRERVRMRTGVADVLLFRVANEMFALELVESEEALDLPALNPLPEAGASMLGVFSIRDTLVSAYSAGVVLGLGASSPGTALVLRGRERKLALAVDDVEDVATIVLDELRDPPVVEADGLLLGVFRHNGHLVALLDADTLLAACRADGAMENA
jgi:purine-binding chemotaxis protein CheW